MIFSPARGDAGGGQGGGARYVINPLWFRRYKKLPFRGFAHDFQS